MRDLVPYFEDLLRILGDELGAEELGAFVITLRAGQFGRLSCFLRYPNGSGLRIVLWADCRDEPILWTRYAFHYFSRDNRELFRYDNAPHHPELVHFPHHLHTKDGLSGVPQPRPREIRQRIAEYMHRDV